MVETPSLETRFSRARENGHRLRQALCSVILGQDEVIDQVLWALVAGGHVLLEGNPGLGKTLLVRTLASCLQLVYSRVQFTPDLMPSDITGTQVLVLDSAGARTGRFEVHKGPIFAHVVLADEINRAAPKTQSALLEAMQEHAVTIAGIRHVLEEPFFVLATENPMEMAGTYPLPEAQLDRFLLKVLITPPPETELVRILRATTELESVTVQPILGREEVLELQQLCRQVIAAEPLLVYAARLVNHTAPEHPQAPASVQQSVRYGAGVRGAQALILAAKAVALLDGRAQISFQDIERVVRPALRHRILRNFEGEASGISEDAILSDVIAALPARPASVERELAGKN